MEKNSAADSFSTFLQAMRDPSEGFNRFFGAPWPSGVCEGGTQVPTPVGEYCLLCQDMIREKDQGSFIGYPDHPLGPCWLPQHRECALRAVIGGIGHLKNHDYWCVQRGDPDMDLSYRESALRVWVWVKEHGIEESRR